ncbi:MAG: hypothetical protein ACLT1X_12255 [Christensenellales bacterium]
MRIELRRGATLLLETDRSKFLILPGMILSTDETDDLNLGSWEGNRWTCTPRLSAGWTSRMLCCTARRAGRAG